MMLSPVPSHLQLPLAPVVVGAEKGVVGEEDMEDVQGGVVEEEADEEEEEAAAEEAAQ